MRETPLAPKNTPSRHSGETQSRETDSRSQDRRASGRSSDRRNAPRTSGSPVRSVAGYRLDGLWERHSTGFIAQVIGQKEMDAVDTNAHAQASKAYGEVQSSGSLHHQLLKSRI